MSSPVDRLNAVFTELGARDELAFMPYQTAGYPTLDESLANLGALASAGADILELGVPFSDPVADGPTIQHTSQVALEQGITLTQVIERLRDTPLDRPVVLMSYINPLLRYGRDRLFADLAATGVCGVIIPDLDLDEADEWLAAARAEGVALIFLLAPTSTDARVEQVAAASDSFIYAVALTGVTGARADLQTDLPAFLARLRQHTDKPLVVGFGIGAPAHIHALHGAAEGVVVASRLLEGMRRGEDWLGLAADLKAATRRDSVAQAGGN